MTTIQKIQAKVSSWSRVGVRRIGKQPSGVIPDQWLFKTGGFNRWMQHTRDCASRRSVADETKTSDLLHGKPESADVGALAER